MKFLQTLGFIMIISSLALMILYELGDVYGTYQRIFYIAFWFIGCILALYDGFDVDDS